MNNSSILNDLERRNYVTKFTASNPSAILTFPDEVQQDYEFIYNIVGINGAALEYVDEVFKDSEEIVLEAIRSRRNALKYASSRIRNSKDFAMELLDIDTINFPYFSEELQNDREVVEKAVTNNGNVLKYLPQQHRLSKEIVYKAVKRNHTAIQYVDKSFSNDKELLLIALSTFPSAYDYVSDNLKCDADMIHLLLSHGGEYFKHLPDSEKNKKEFALSSVHKHPNNYFQLNNMLQNNQEVLDEIIIHLNKEHPKHVDQELMTCLNTDYKNNFTFILQLLNSTKIDPAIILTNIGNNLKNNIGALSYFVSNYNIDPDVYIIDSLKDDKHLGLLLVSKNGHYLEKLSNSLKANSDIVMAACMENINAIQYADDVIKTDKNFIRKLLLSKGNTCNNSALRYLGEEILNDAQFLSKVIEYKPFNVAYIGEQLKQDINFIVDLVKKDGEVYKYLPNELKNNQQVAKIAVKSNYELISVVSEDLRNDTEFMYSIYEQTERQNIRRWLDNYVGKKIVSINNESSIYTYLKKCHEQRLLEDKLIVQLNENGQIKDQANPQYTKKKL
jgi:hypothetical protein